MNLLAAALGSTGLGTLAIGAYAAALGQGAQPLAAAAALLAAISLASRSGPLAPLGRLLGFVATLAAAAFALPAIGSAALALVGGACWLLALTLAAAEPSEPTSAPDALLAALTATLWAALLSLFLAHSLYGFAAACAGVILGARLGASIRLPAPGLGALLAAVAGCFGLAFLRMLGLNAAEAERLVSVWLSRGDLLLLWAQPALLAALPAAALAAASQLPPRGAGAYGKGAGAAEPSSSFRGAGRPLSDAAGALCALLGAAAAALLVDRLGASAAFLAAHAALAAYGGARAWSWLRARATAWQVAAVGLALAAAAGGSARRFEQDIWRARLAAAYPGGDFLLRSERGGESRALFRFSTGEEVQLRNGIAHARDAAGARWTAHLAALSLDPEPGPMLLLHPAHPETLAAASLHASSLDWVDPHPAALPLMRLLARRSDWSVPPRTRGPLARVPGGKFKLIIAEARAPLEAPENAFSLSRQALRGNRQRLEPGGALVLVLPHPHREAARRRLLATVAAEFPFVALLEAPRLSLLFASERAAEPPPAPVIQRFDAMALPAAEREGPALTDWRWTPVEAGSESAETAWNSRNAFFAADLWRRRF